MAMAAIIYKKGAPDNFVWEEIKVGAPERGQVRLRSTAVGVNFADTYHRAGIPHPMIVGDPPVILGFEGVGEIEELGPDVSGFSVGERVCTCLPPLGAYSQERLYPADKLIKVPKDLPLDDVQLAGLILKGMTAQYLLHRTHKVQPGDYVLIHAAAGGMGHILCPWARHLGAAVIGTVSTDAKAEIARNLGCLGRIAGYATDIGFSGHAVAETNQDLKALISAAPAFSGPGFLLPTRNHEVFAWCLSNRLRLVMQMTLMTIGLYNEPSGAWLPSIRL